MRCARLVVFVSLAGAVAATSGWPLLLGCGQDDPSTPNDGVDADRSVDGSRMDSAMAIDGAESPDGAKLDGPETTDSGASDGAGNADADAATTCVLSDAADSGAPPPGMVYVSAGPFVMGSDPNEGEFHERPERIVSLSAYFIDGSEVTNAEYRACVTAGGCSAPASPSSHTLSNYYTDVARDDYPVVHVTWFQAESYCTWRGKRLPTEAEWEKAARGGCEIVQPASCGPEDERPLPWGESGTSCTQANHSPETFSYCVSFGDPDRVGARSPAGDSPYGAHDMAGNVWEWVADWHANYAPANLCNPAGPASGDWRVRRGGSWANAGIDLRVSKRSYAPPFDHADGSGFRCAQSP